MAITASYLERNSAVALTLNNAAATQSIDISDKSGERVVIFVDNQNSTEGQTATVTISKGDYIASAAGALAVEVAKGAQTVIGPLETSRFKTFDGELNVAVAVTNSGTISNVKIGIIKLP